MSIAIATTPSGAILFDTSQVATPSDDLFDDQWWKSQGRIVARAQGRGGVIFVRQGDHNWVLRHYRRGGAVAKLLGDRYFWTGAENTRAFREWRLLHRLHTEGLPVPAPIATRYVRAGIFYRADLLTAALPATRPLSDSITGASLDESIWRHIGATIAQFHRAGVHHADLNAHNILLGEGGSAFIVDFDRGQLRERGAWEQAVLARLLRSLEKIKRQRHGVQFDDRAWGVLKESYEAERHADA